jgi:hypothetical protein
MDSDFDLGSDDKGENSRLGLVSGTGIEIATVIPFEELSGPDDGTDTDLDADPDIDAAGERGDEVSGARSGGRGTVGEEEFRSARAR